jgi:hypothetical protein
LYFESARLPATLLQDLLICPAKKLIHAQNRFTRLEICLKQNGAHNSMKDVNQASIRQRPAAASPSPAGRPSA